MEAEPDISDSSISTQAGVGQEPASMPWGHANAAFATAV